MTRVPNIVPVSDLRQDVALVLRRLHASREPIFITQRGRTAAVLLSVEAYERAANERELLRLLARGEREVTKGKGHSLEEVLREADALLARDET